MSVIRFLIYGVTCLTVAFDLAAGEATVEPLGKPWNCHVIDDVSRGADGVKLIVEP